MCRRRIKYTENLFECRMKKSIQKEMDEYHYNGYQRNYVEVFWCELICSSIGYNTGNLWKWQRNLGIMEARSFLRNCVTVYFLTIF